MPPDYPDPTLPELNNGVVRGDDKALPDRGSSTGFCNVGDDHYGRDLSPGATNRLGPATDTGSDAAELRFPKGDEDRFTASSNTTRMDSPGEGFGPAADSDPPGEDRSDNPKGLGTAPDADSAEDQAEYEGR